MIISLRKWWERAKFVALFLFLTILLHVVLQAAENRFKPDYDYRKPHGQAVKAGAKPDAVEFESMRDRLMFFYWFGE
ncbi:MAG TPA: DUF4227 family protein [Bacilli bacterium]